MLFLEKTVVITGASMGIGAALARRLSGEGARLVLAARSPERLEAVADACARLGSPVLAVETDVTDPEQCRRLMEKAVGTFGGIDLLVNNAGRSMWARVDEITDLTVFERLMQVNYLGAVYCTYHALPALKKSRGLIVAVSSLAGKLGVPTRAAYSASKHAMQGFFDSLRIELREDGVDVLVVSPGFVATDIRAHALGPAGQPLPRVSQEEGPGVMPVEQCVDLMVRAMVERRREVVMTLKGRLGQWARLAAPGLVDRIAARAVRELPPNF